MIIDEIEIRFRIEHNGKQDLSDTEKEKIEEDIQLSAIDEYRLCNMIDFDFEETDETHHHFRAVFSDN